MAERDGRGRFAPGTSGNPGGRSSESLAAIGRARELSLDAVELLWGIGRDPKVNPATRTTALVALLDRGLGRPRQSVQLEAAGLTRAEAALEELSDDELRAIVQAPRVIEAG